MATSIFEVRRYAQFALGGIQEDGLQYHLREGYFFQAARTMRVARDYFFEKTGGFKQLAKIPGVVEACLEWRGIVAIPSSKLRTVFEACAAVKGVIFTGETISFLKGVSRPLDRYSVWSEKSEASWQEWALAKGADVADWTMALCDSHKWLAKIGFFTARTSADVVFNCASLVFSLYSAKTEAAKWMTGKVINPMTGVASDFTWSEKGKSMLSIALTVAYIAFTVISFAEMAKYRVAHAAFLNFALLTTEVVTTIGIHFWEELILS
jgi:hypothetical protein